jgi:hypothetical protein
MRSIKTIREIVTNLQSCSIANAKQAVATRRIGVKQRIVIPVKSKLAGENGD